MNSALDFDRQHIWHPYSSIGSDNPVFHVERAEGCELILKDGRRLIDGMASWWSVIHGYNHPTMNAALKAQIDKMSHVMFGGLTHDPAIELAQQLVAMTAPELEAVFFADSGSVSVEVAMKMAIQYWASSGQPGKQRFLTVRNGYHGDTFGAMSVCDPVNGMHSLFASTLAQQVFAPAPEPAFDAPCEAKHLAELTRLLEAHQHELAAIIIEPVVQGAGGMRFYAPGYLDALRALADAHQVLLIFDEIATGFGRTGKLFAYEHTQVVPDILCLGKALTGGYMTLAATLTSEKISRTINQGEPGVFMHGPTFMGNPLACTAALTSLQLLQESNWQQQVKGIEQGLQQGLAACRALDSVAEVRVLGAIGVVELKEPVVMRDFQPKLVEAGVWVRPFGKLVYVMPPYVMSDAQLATLCGAIFDCIRDHHVVA
ncbi:MAG: adenosylmethionine--8-amino-7-oxononanoate transaminase [Oleiphilaceae bacterium]|nr:adenosylmethionine--8-amino-7-oxononanoate transaminase [Oleiphilaceae bacterium]